MQALVELAVAETNTAFINSGIHTQLSLVHSFRHDTYVEPSFDGALSDLKGTSDGKMDEIHALRDQYGADLVVLIIDDPQYCGLGYVGPSKDWMFSVSAWNCATGYYTFGHEIGYVSLLSSNKAAVVFMY
jgi:peptidyl-Asp metalloendopeptidase